MVEKRAAYSILLFNFGIVYLYASAVYAVDNNGKNKKDGITRRKVDYKEVVCKPECYTQCDDPPPLECEEVYKRPCRRCAPELVRIECPPPPEIKCERSCKTVCRDIYG